MEFRLAVMRDLPKLKAVYGDIIEDMNSRQIAIWDDVYPCAFFEEDIKNNRLYVLVSGDEILSAFALCDTSQGEASVEWMDSRKKALYLERLGVNVSHAGKGIGSLMLKRARETAKELGAEYLRLFVVDINEPAIRLYGKNGFTRANGVYNEAIDEGLVLREYGFEAVSLPEKTAPSQPSKDRRPSKMPI